MISSSIVPAVIPTSLPHLQTQLIQLGPVSELHLDIVDGVFVSHTSWPYFDGDDIQAAKTLLAPYTLEVDLMVTDPMVAASLWIKQGADRLVFHVETISEADFKQFADTTSVTVGIAASNGTPFEVLAPYLEAADFVQVMGIAEIGSQGQPFDNRALDRLEMVARLYPTLDRSLDGSVNVQTLPELLALKLNRYIMGSAIMAAIDPQAAYVAFSRLARSSQQV